MNANSDNPLSLCAPWVGGRLLFVLAQIFTGRGIADVVQNFLSCTRSYR
jgi:hypothetical protein